MTRVPDGEVKARVSALRRRLAGRGLAGALISSRADRFYLSGTVQDGLLWIDALGDPILWILRDADRAAGETPLDVVRVPGRRELWSLVRRVVAKDSPGIVADTLTVADFGRLGLDLGLAVDVSPELLDLRSRKSPWEVERMEEAGRLAVEVYAYAAEALRAGMTEAELAGLLFARAMARGHEGLLRSRGGFEAYSWHVLSGPNAALPGANDSPMSGRGPSPSFPVGAGNRQIRRGEPVLVDFGICLFGYQTDQTRTFCIGPPPAWLRDAHLALDEVHSRALGALVPGARAGDAFAAGEERATALGLPGYLGPAGRKCRFVGHGIGLETVEPPILAEGSSQALETGMTIASEPKAVLEDLGGVGMEDTVLVTESGHRSLTPIPRGLLVV